MNYETEAVTIKKLELPNIVDHRIPPYVYVSSTSIRGKSKIFIISLKKINPATEIIALH